MKKLEEFIEDIKKFRWKRLIRIYSLANTIDLKEKYESTYLLEDDVKKFPLNIKMVANFILRDEIYIILDEDRVEKLTYFKFEKILCSIYRGLSILFICVVILWKL